jgi:hypothetical protein
MHLVGPQLSDEEVVACACHRGPHHFRVVKGMGTTVVQVVRVYELGIRYDDYSDFLPIGLS